jgi:uncharacterized protein (TIGR00725 family)
MNGEALVYIAVVGAGMAAARPSDLHAAEAVGRGVAEAGGVVVCGGLGGVMEAACRGARSADGVTVGILPGADRSTANPFVTIAIPTGMGELRNGLVVRTADAVVAVGGEWGTLSEIALAVKSETPVVGLGTWDLGRGEIEMVDEPGDAVARALALGRGRVR